MQFNLVYFLHELHNLKTSHTRDSSNCKNENSNVY